ncbi:putative undecaprenyl-phosphate N-acetylgalactosaminyl 1-phosphate transferase [Abditibacteriota bacterium]|nr:putative undecaprenyl-phosphate N-acetylgalactosaminyl 1-phosphate transferase [Abditibacteriota bacterium]
MKNRAIARYRAYKHTLDLLLALVLLMPLLPLLGLLCLAIRLESRGPALYCQKRVGRFGRPFTIYKLRSMKIDTPVLSTEEMQRQQFNPFTRLGPLLRKTNLDELPQIFNILKGEMSFVGPRPALPTQTDVNTLRHQEGVEIARPGITGLAQVKGRDDLDTQTKVTYDAHYCRAMSLKADVGILWATLEAVLTGRGNK